MRRLVDAEPEVEPDLDEDGWADDLPPQWSRSVVGGVEGLRCREHDLLPQEH